jgi:hypothetical protein
MKPIAELASSGSKVAVLLTVIVKVSWILGYCDEVLGYVLRAPWGGGSAYKKWLKALIR